VGFHALAAPTASIPELALSPGVEIEPPAVACSALKCLLQILNCSHEGAALPARFLTKTAYWPGSPSKMNPS